MVPDDKMIETARAAVANGLKAAGCASVIGVGLRTWQRWLALGQAEPGGVYGPFYRAVEAGRGEAQMHCMAIIRAAAPQDWHAAAWVLERVYGYTKPPHIVLATQATTAADVTLDGAEARVTSMMEGLESD